MTPLKETVQQLARRRAEKALAVIAVAQELHDEGTIDAAVLIQVTSEAEQGFPYEGQDILERAVAVHLLERESLQDGLFLVTDSEDLRLPLKHIMDGRTSPTLKPAA